MNEHDRTWTNHMRERGERCDEHGQTLTTWTNMNEHGQTWTKMDEPYLRGRRERCDKHGRTISEGEGEICDEHGRTWTNMDEPRRTLLDFWTSMVTST